MLARTIATIAHLLISQVHLPCVGDITEALRSSDGAVVELGAGQCEIKAPIRNTKATRIVGQDVDHTSIRAQRGAFVAGASLKLRDLKIWRADFLTETSTKAIGVLANAEIEMEHVRLDGFTVGIVISASDKNVPPTNADSWRLNDVDVFNTAGPSIIVGYAGNRTTNAGVSIGIRSTTACKRGSRWQPIFGPCAGVVDQAWLGNKWSGVVVHSTYEITKTSTGVSAIVYPAIRSINGESSWDGVYCERDSGPPWIDAGVVMIGGHCTKVLGPGLRISGTYFSGIELVNDTDPDPRMWLSMRMGRRASAGHFVDFEADGIDKKRPLGLRVCPATATLPFRYCGDIANGTVKVFQLEQNGKLTVEPNKTIIKP